MSYSGAPYNVTDVEIPPPYRDEPFDEVVPGEYDDDYSDVENTQPYRDEPSDEVVFGEHDLITTHSRHSTGGCSHSRFITLLAVCVLAALAFGGWQYYGHGVGNSSDSNSVSGLEDGPPPGSKGIFQKKVGVRGNNSSNDEEGESSGSSTLNDEGGDDGAHDETVVENKNKAAAPRPNDEKAKAIVSTMTTTPEVKEIVAPKKSATNKSVVLPVAATNQPPPKPKPTVDDDDCQDDNTFIMPNLKTCQTFIAHVGRPHLLDVRCGKGSGVLDQNGNELLLKNFCRRSCKNCDTHASPMQDLAEEENESQEESTTFEEKAEIASNGDVGCEDDNAQQFSNGKTCATFVAHVGKPKLHDSRCSGLSGIKDEKNGGELLIKHFCKNSCKYCDEVALSTEEAASNKGGKNEHAEEMDHSEEENTGVVNEAGKAEDVHNGKHDHAEESDNIKKGETGVPDEASGAEGDQNGKHGMM
mmetsp:Transcript_24216/g.52350  ORF Transcript_24216/g.52350 Transcript_24216/m.52350 type:complete len:471 (+) Transcript_24216:460-1872(+)